MQTYVAMLRGINIGPNKRVAMGDLRALIEELGAANVRTYIQSGNVVFDSPVDQEAKLTQAIEAGIAKTLGLTVTVILRTARELKEVAASKPFGGADPAALHVTFLAKAPPKRASDPDTAGSSADEVQVIGREVYLHLPEGYGRSKLNNAFFEKRLGVAATTRNWRTVTTLADMAND